MQNEPNFKTGKNALKNNYNKDLREFSPLRALEKQTQSNPIQIEIKNLRHFSVPAPAVVIHPQLIQPYIVDFQSLLKIF